MAAMCTEGCSARDVRHNFKDAMIKVLKTVARAVLTVGSKVWTVTEGDGGTGGATERLRSLRFLLWCC